MGGILGGSHQVVLCHQNCDGHSTPMPGQPHCSTAYAESPSLIPTPEWLFPPRDTEGVEGGDILSQPFSPDEVIQQFRRMKNTAPGIDGLTYATWRWVDPKGLILALVFNICRHNSSVPSTWKHSIVTLITRGASPRS